MGGQVPGPVLFEHQVLCVAYPAAIWNPRHRCFTSQGMRHFEIIMTTTPQCAALEKVGLCDRTPHLHAMNSSSNTSFNANVPKLHKACRIAIQRVLLTYHHQSLRTALCNVTLVPCLLKILGLFVTEIKSFYS